jgi:xylosylprotein 4-beta-galactosyltransferase
LHRYKWGWGQEDDDLGARLAHAGVTHAKPFAYPGARPQTKKTADEEYAEDAAALVRSTRPCTGRVQRCDHDPGERDCGVYPYSRLKAMFHPTPAQSLEGLALPPGRSLVEGACFIHAHEGGFSR